MADTIRCPKCKTEQRKQPICSHCGFDIRAYALALKKKQAAGPKPAGATITCPKCKTKQPKKPICSHCGFDIRAYALTLKKKQAPQAARPQPVPAGKPRINQKALEALLPKRDQEVPPPEELRSVADLFSESWDIYKRRLGPLIALYLLSIVFFVLPLALFIGGGVILAVVLSEVKAFLIGGGTLVGMTFSLVGMCWGMAALTAGVVDERLGIKASLGRGWSMLWVYIWLISLAWYVITGTAFLLFIPGLIFLVWAFPSQFVLFAEEERGMNALLKSREYVRGYWTDTFIKLFIIWLALIVAGFVPLGQLFFFPFMMIYLFKMFDNLRHIKGSVIIYSTSVRSKLAWLGLSTLGLALPVVLMVALLGPTMKQSLPAIIEAVETGQFQALITPPPPTPVSKGLVRPLKDLYAQDEPIIIEYSGLPGNHRDWITVIKATDSDSKFGQWFYTYGQQSGQHTFEGLEPGVYEVRVYFDWPDGGYTVQDRYQFVVTTYHQTPDKDRSIPDAG